MNYPSTHQSLLERVQNGDEVSWNEFYYLYAPVIRVAGKRYGFNDSECSDLVQMVMLKFFGSGKVYVYRQGKVKFRTWFTRVIRSCAIDSIRNSARQKAFQAEALEQTDPFGELFLTEWRNVVFEEAKDELRRRVDTGTYQAFEMYGLQNRNAEQVAETLGMTVNQLYVAKNRCMTILRKIVKRLNEIDPEVKIEL